MKSLANERDKDEILLRLERVSPASPRRWGKMSAHQMVCHVSDAYRLYMGMITADSPGFPYPSRALKIGSLWMPFRWPRNFKTVREVDQEIGGSRPAEFQSDIDELKRLLQRFVREPREFAWPIHPLLGALSEWEWMRLGYLHTDHHLRQFGA